MALHHGGNMLVKQAELFSVVAQPGQFPETELPQIAFAGRSNVGKSSLINGLLKRKNLARTSGTPGKTRQLFYYRINQTVDFVDLPGYGYAQISKQERAHFKVLVDAYFAAPGNLRACLLLLDPRRPVGEEEIRFLKFLQQQAIPAVVVFTKWDRVRSSQRTAMSRKRTAEFAGAAPTILFTSARTREGLDSLWRVLTGHLETQEKSS